MKRLACIPVLLLVLLPVAACNSGGATSGGGQASPSTGTSAGNAMVNFAKCARDHGVNVPDPDPNSSNQSLVPPSGVQAPQWTAVLQACQQFLPNGGAPQAPDPRELDGLRAYAVCMREHGIEVSDPDPNTGQSTIGGRLANATRTQIENDPGYQAASQACQDKLVTDGGHK